MFKGKWLEGVSGLSSNPGRIPFCMLPGKLNVMESHLVLLRSEFCTKPVNFAGWIIPLMNTIRLLRSIAASHASTRWPGQSKRKQGTSGARKAGIQEQFISSFGWRQDSQTILPLVIIVKKG